MSTKLVPTFADRGVSHGQCGESPTAVISVFQAGYIYIYIYIYIYLINDESYFMIYTRFIYAL
jgi:hypothetical protein